MEVHDGVRTDDSPMSLGEVASIAFGHAMRVEFAGREKSEEEVGLLPKIGTPGESP